MDESALSRRLNAILFLQAVVVVLLAGIVLSIGGTEAILVAVLAVVFLGLVVSAVGQLSR